MTKGLLLDTHAWLWSELGTRVLPRRFEDCLGEALFTHSLYIASISLHEVAYASLRKRVDLTVSLKAWFEGALADGQPTILPITQEVAVASALLPSGFHGDPADRVIAATAIVHNLTLCTHDHKLIRHAAEASFTLLEI